jgi:CO dehydrogenase nickel-insertion accessory protein CooC1
MPPTNYDDINELSLEDIRLLVDVCANDSDFLIIDMPCVCDKRTQAIMEGADLILLISDGSSTAEAKLNIFFSQHCVFNDVRHKMHLILNKAAKTLNAKFDTAINLPRVQTDDPISIFKTLSGNTGLDC